MLSYYIRHSEKVKKMKTPNFEILKKIVELTKQIDWDEMEKEVDEEGSIDDDEWDEFTVDCHESMYKLRNFSQEYI